MKFLKKIILLILISLLSGCYTSPPMGMIKDSSTGIAYGSKVGKTFFIDSEQFSNKTIKVTARNATGDPALDIRGITNDIYSEFQSKGYDRYSNDGFGLKVDVVIEYNGRVTRDLSKQYAILGGAAGLYAGTGTKKGAAAGLVAGAALGSIVGSYQTEDTYIIIAKVRVGILDGKSGKNTRTIVFSSSPKLEEKEDDGIKRFREVGETAVAVYAGGRNVSQGQVISGVKQRLARIVSDLI